MEFMPKAWHPRNHEMKAFPSIISETVKSPRVAKVKTENSNKEVMGVRTEAIIEDSIENGK